jgi:leucine dehydrogenase
MNLAKLLVTEGTVVIGTDIRPEVVRQASMDLPMEVVAPEAIYEVPAAIFAPCALGGVLNDRTIGLLSCQIVAGAANNQLEDNRMAAEALQHPHTAVPIKGEITCLTCPYGFS